MFAAPVKPAPKSAAAPTAKKAASSSLFGDEDDMFAFVEKSSQAKEEDKKEKARLALLEAEKAMQATVHAEKERVAAEAYRAAEAAKAAEDAKQAAEAAKAAEDTKRDAGSAKNAEKQDIVKDAVPTDESFKTVGKKAKSGKISGLAGTLNFGGHGPPMMMPGQQHPGLAKKEEERRTTSKEIDHVVATRAAPKGRKKPAKKASFAAESLSDGFGGDNDEGPTEASVATEAAPVPSVAVIPVLPAVSVPQPKPSVDLFGDDDDLFSGAPKPKAATPKAAAPKKPKKPVADLFGDVESDLFG